MYGYDGGAAFGSICKTVSALRLRSLVIISIGKRFALGECAAVFGGHAPLQQFFDQRDVGVNVLEAEEPFAPTNRAI